MLAGMNRTDSAPRHAPPFPPMHLVFPTPPCRACHAGPGDSLQPRISLPFAGVAGTWGWSLARGWPTHSTRSLLSYLEYTQTVTAQTHRRRRELAWRRRVRVLWIWADGANTRATAPWWMRHRCAAAAAEATASTAGSSAPVARQAVTTTGLGVAASSATRVAAATCTRVRRRQLFGREGAPGGGREGVPHSWTQHCKVSDGLHAARPRRRRGGRGLRAV